MPFRLYKMGVGFMLAHPYGFTRVMSSYHWPRHFENGKVSFGAVQNIFFSNKKNNFGLISHDAITFTSLSNIY